MPWLSPAMAPTSVRSGWPSDADWMGGELAATGAGRRVGEKIGRSRVAFNEVRGMAHNGFPNPIELGSLVP
jgi:hypothetical protein